MSALQKLTILTAFIWLTAQNQVTANCSCGIFSPKTSDTTTDEPILTTNPNNTIECAATVNDACAKICTSLALREGDKALDLICDKLEDTTEPFTPKIYSKACDDKSWTNTGHESSIKVCCVKKAVTACK